VKRVVYHNYWCAGSMLASDLFMPTNRPHSVSAASRLRMLIAGRRTEEDAGGNLTLVRRVQPVYPAVMQSAHVTGQVVLDAIINPDGNIGDITVLKSTNEAFAQSAIQAVKQWRATRRSASRAS
jgi:TonB family protein